VSELATDIGCSPSSLSLAWLMHQPCVSTVIVGATKVEQLEDNITSVNVELNEEQLNRLDEISRRYRYGEPFAVYRLPE